MNVKELVETINKRLLNGEIHWNTKVIVYDEGYDSPRELTGPDVEVIMNFEEWGEVLVFWI